LTEYIQLGKLDKAQKLFRTLKKIMLVAGIALVVLGSAIGPFAVAFLTHQKYNLPEFWFVLPLMLLLSAVSYGYDLVLLTLFAVKEDFWFMKREFIALLLAGLLFGASFLFTDLSLKMALILLGAICGESFMVISGFLRIQKKHLT
jgi:hypothetical protein